MKSEAPGSRVVFLHMGTHKTGTTSIQAMLGMNASLFRAAGIFVPRMTRTNPTYAGHHNLAFELANDKNFDARHGTLADLIAEIQQQTVSTVCLSSEELSCLVTKPAAARRLSGALKAVGFAVQPIVYLRPQSDYLESLYAEISRQWPLTFAEFKMKVMTSEAFIDVQFNYFRLLNQIEETLEPSELHVRCYDRQASTAAIIRNYLDVICGNRHRIDFAALRLPERLNKSLTFDEVLWFNERILGGRENSPAKCSAEDAGHDLRFEPLTLADLAEICLRFLPSNDKVRRKYGVVIGAVSSARLMRECVRAIIGEPALDRRRREIRLTRSADLASRLGSPALRKGFAVCDDKTENPARDLTSARHANLVNEGSSL